MNKTGIEYLDFTANPIVGCDMSLPCAERCWARRMARRIRAQGNPTYQTVVDDKGNWTGQTAFCEEALRELLRRRKPAVVGIGFMADIFHESVPDEWLDRVFAVMALTPHLRYLIPTKRAKRMREWFGAKTHGPGSRWWAVSNATAMIAQRVMNQWPLSNVALGISASNQAELDARAGDLLRTPAAMRFLSLEPILGVVKLYGLSGHGKPEWDAGGDIHHPFYGALLNWVVLGGESGPGARPCHPDWVRSVRDQCVSAGVPFYFKQWGEWGQHPHPAQRGVNTGAGLFVLPNGQPGCQGDYWDGKAAAMDRVGKRAAGRLLEGREWLELPAWMGAAGKGSTA